MLSTTSQLINECIHAQLEPLKLNVLATLLKTMQVVAKHFDSTLLRELFQLFTLRTNELRKRMRLTRL